MISKDDVVKTVRDILDVVPTIAEKIEAIGLRAGFVEMIFRPPVMLRSYDCVTVPLEGEKIDVDKTVAEFPTDKELEDILVVFHCYNDCVYDTLSVRFYGPINSDRFKVHLFSMYGKIECDMLRDDKEFDYEKDFIDEHRYYVTKKNIVRLFNLPSHMRSTITPISELNTLKRRRKELSVQGEGDYLKHLSHDLSSIVKDTYTNTGHGTDFLAIRAFINTEVYPNYPSIGEYLAASAEENIDKQEWKNPKPVHELVKKFKDDFAERCRLYKEETGIDYMKHTESKLGGHDNVLDDILSNLAGE